MSDTVLTKRENGIMTITMNRPDVLNALDMELCDALNREILSVEQDNDIRCVVIRGGEQFMAGGDIKYFSENKNFQPKVLYLMLHLGCPFLWKSITK